MRQGTRYVVYTVDAQDLAQPRDVALGEFFVDGVHVTSGIAAGEQVVVSGQQKLPARQPRRAAALGGDENPNVDVGRYGPADCGPT